ncbi:uncharacterized protein PHALS_10794 [Plasmopara halstedii]|uniref:Uncharacterized protein n=1 Tax=Plasmopara halstedii TaxID=4781 RepID=A0A0P1AHZ7_PLAHL|nr:uncharacterized protein PHALS_10794 [Plasmopara halstedii]CEG40608.1 hypothetical protein PHALS_10794 [Plasmopara halstedii]|eukprot:XP_024576977.1 hypothetical protein PHALS_10794 [Plasmopara halstedii]
MTFARASSSDDPKRKTDLHTLIREKKGILATAALGQKIVLEGLSISEVHRTGSHGTRMTLLISRNTHRNPK